MHMRGESVDVSIAESCKLGLGESRHRQKRYIRCMHEFIESKFYGEKKQISIVKTG